MKRSGIMPAAYISVFIVMAIYAAVTSLPPSSTPVFCEAEEWQHG